MSDINDLDLSNEVVEVNPESDAEQFFRPPLPDDGDHLAVLKLGDRKVKKDRQRDEAGDKKGKGFLNVHLAEEILDPDTREKTFTVFDQVTSVLMPNSGTTKLHAILDICGDSAPARCTLDELQAHTENVLAQSPQVIITTQWEARNEDPTKPEGSRDRYYTVLKGQKRFPFNESTGKYSTEAEDPKTGEKVQAQVRVLRYKRA